MRRPAFAIALFGLSCVLVIGSVVAAGPPAQVPEGPAVTAAEKTIREVYKAEFAKKKAADQVELARKLLKAGDTTVNDPAARYTLYREARILAAKAGDVTLSLEAAATTIRAFEVNRVDLIIATLEASEKAPSAPHKAIVELALDAADEAMQADDYATAARFLRVASVAASRTKMTALTSLVSARTRETDAMQNAYESLARERKELAGNPADVIGATRVGRFLCLTKGDWAAGLPLLAKGEDEKLKAAAKKDLGGPTDAPAKVEAGDGWYDLGEGFDARERAEARTRAHMWYHQAAPFLTGLPRDRVDKRLEELKKVVVARVGRAGAGGWRVLFRSADPGIWNTDTIRAWDDFAVTLARAPADTRYLKLTDIGKPQFVVIDMSRTRLADRTEQDGYGWNGSRVHKWNGHHLGIYAIGLADFDRGNIAIFYGDGTEKYRGWGFGHRYLIDDQQGYTWVGESIDKTVFEIAVKTSPLTPAEEKLLLRKSP